MATYVPIFIILFLYLRPITELTRDIATRYRYIIVWTREISSQSQFISKRASLISNN